MDLQSYIVQVVTFTNEVFIPFLLGLAFLFFIINTVRYFVIGGNNQDSQEKAKATATYSVAAFVFIVVFWGIVNIVANSLGLNRDCYEGQVSDYVANQAERAGSPRSQIEPCAPIQPSAPNSGTSPTIPTPFNDTNPNRNSPSPLGG